MLPRFNISNFSKDWTDGRAFAALTNKCFPGILSQYASLKKTNALDNIRLVLDTIKAKLGITPNFTAKKISCGEVDELQVMTLIMRIRDGKLQPLPNEIVVSGPGIHEAVVDKATYFNIDTAQAGPGQLTVEATYISSGRKVDCSFQREGRIIRVNYSPNYAGKLTIDVRWSDIHVSNSPFQVKVSDSMMVKIVDFDSHKRVVHIRKLNSSSSVSPTDRDSKSFWDMTMLGVESIISLTTADEEKWMCTQVSYYVDYIDSI